MKIVAKISCFRSFNVNNKVYVNFPFIYFLHLFFFSNPTRCKPSYQVLSCRSFFFLITWWISNLRENRVFLNQLRTMSGCVQERMFLVRWFFAESSTSIPRSWEDAAPDPDVSSQVCRNTIDSPYKLRHSHPHQSVPNYAILHLRQ